MFEELCRLSPEHYQPSHLRTLQRGVQKIRARLALLDVQFQDGLYKAKDVHSVECDEQGESTVAMHEQEAREEETQDAVQLSLWNCMQGCFDKICRTEDFKESLARCHTVERAAAADKNDGAVEVQSEDVVTPIPQVKTSTCVTLAEGIEQYLRGQQQAGRRPKTLEWHGTALRLLEQYVRTEWECVLLAELTESHIQGWIQWLRKPTALGTHRTESTLLSYARSVRAWCYWLVNSGHLMRMPFKKLPLQKGELPAMQLLRKEHWERLLLACELAGESGPIPE